MTNQPCKNTTLLIGGLTLLTAALFVWALAAGPAGLTLTEVFRALSGHGFSAADLIVREIRLPRALLAILIGGSLGLSGACLQGWLKNPLAEPGVLGVSGGAVLGAVTAFYTGYAALFPIALPLGGLAGALLAVLFLLLLSGFSGTTATLILAGVAVNTLAFAATALALNFSHNPYAALEIVFWQMGSLADRGFDHVWLALPFILSGCILLLSTGRALNALSLGDDTAASLGIHLGWLRWRLVIGTALCVGAGVAVAGSIGFVGLVVPHLLRPLTRHEPGRLLVPSMLGGAALLLAADLAVRLLPAVSELKIGVLTSLIGAPFFLVLILRGRREAL